MKEYIAKREIRSCFEFLGETMPEANVCVSIGTSDRDDQIGLITDSCICSLKSFDLGRIGRQEATEILIHFEIACNEDSGYCDQESEKG